MIVKILENIATNNDTELEKYRLDIFSMICNFFKTIHDLLMIFCSDNVENQTVLMQELPLFMSNKSVNFGQIELLAMICKKNTRGKEVIKMNLNSQISQQTEPIVEYLFQLIHLHGFLPPVLRFLLEIIKPNEENVNFVKKIILVKLFSKEHLPFLRIEKCYAKEEDNPAKIPSEQDGKARELKHNGFSFEASGNSSLFELLTIKLISVCMERQSGINIITKAFELYKASLMIQTFAYRLSTFPRTITNEGQNLQRTELREYFEGIVKLLDIYVITFDKSFIRDLVNEKVYDAFFDIFSQISELMEAKLIYCYLMASKAAMINILKLVTSVSNVFLKCSVNHINSDKAVTILSTFASKLLNGFDPHISASDLQIDEIMVIKSADKALKFDLPQNIKVLLSNYQEKLSAVDGIEDTLGRVGKDPSASVPGLFSESLTRQLTTLPEVLDQPDTLQRDMTEEERWTSFLRYMSLSAVVQPMLEKEKAAIINTLLNFCLAYNSDDLDEIMIFCEDLAGKLVSALEFWLQRRLSKKNSLFLIRVLSDLCRVSKVPAERMKLQKMLNNFGIMKVVIKLFVQEDDLDINFLDSLLNLGGAVLEGGNSEIQDDLYIHFTRETTITEKFFEKVDRLISKQALFLSSIRESLQQPTLENAYFPLRIIEVLRKFCENHHSDLQNYIRFQPNSKTQHNLVEGVLVLLNSCKLSEFTVPIIDKIFDALTEFSQGPCPGNQILIASSGFLEFVAGLMETDRKYIGGVKSTTINNATAMVSQLSVGMKSLLDSKFLNKVKPYKIERLRYKCLITVMALLEKTDKDSQIIERIRKVLPINSLKNSLVRIYDNYYRIYGDKYVDRSFGWFDKKIDPRVSEKYYECIIENGFNIFLLSQTMIDSVKKEEEDRYSKLVAYRVEINNCEAPDRKEKRATTQSSKKDTEENRRRLIKRALRFFKSKIVSIDIVRDNKLEKVYFPKMPYCFNLPKKVN